MFVDPDTELNSDPFEVYLTIRKPDGTQVTYQHEEDAEIVRESIGVFKAQVYLDAVGVWAYRWWSLGHGAASSEKLFRVPEILTI